MSDKKNVNLNQYSKKEFPPMEQVPQLIKTQSDYKAVEAYNRGRFARFRIIDANGVSYGCSYSHLIKWVFTPPSLLSIQLSSEIFTIEGEKLHEIDRLLLEDKVKELRVFDKTRYKQPPQGQAIITNLQIDAIT